MEALLKEAVAGTEEYKTSDADEEESQKEGGNMLGHMQYKVYESERRC